MVLAAEKSYRPRTIAEGAFAVPLHGAGEGLCDLALLVQPVPQRAPVAALERRLTGSQGVVQLGPGAVVVVPRHQ